MGEDKKTVKLTIDDQEVEVPAGINVIEAAKAVDVDIPHYCYHSHLSIAGNCRMCMVEVENARGMPIACNTIVQDGMVVNTETEKVKETRAAVMEFMLVNHPIDCPVCDQAGECWLQIYYMEHDRRESVIPLEAKVEKGKAIEVGPRVMLDQERCIACTRCIRFCDEVTETGELRIFNRTDRVTIGTYPGKPLDNDYSVNTADICPVGALTQRDFRFQARVWYTREMDTICPGCATGCNTKLSYHDHARLLEYNGVAYRMKPRVNDDVNQAWMCDLGRGEYARVNDGRVQQPITSGIEVSWDGALSTAAKLLDKARADDGEVAGVAGFDCTNEEIRLFRKLMKDVFGQDHIAVVALRDDGKSDDFLIDADKHPNRRGAVMAAGEAMIDDVAAYLEGKTGVVVLGADLLADVHAAAVREAFVAIKHKVVFAANESGTTEAAAVVLPTTSYAEKDGTWINRQDRVQTLRRGVKKFKMDCVDDLEAMARLAKVCGVDWGRVTAESVFDVMATEIAALDGLRFSEIGKLGRELGQGRPMAKTASGGES